MMAIKQICDDPEPVSHGYMDLSEEGRGIVDLHRSYKHAVATGDYDYAQELEEEMKMMRFNWGKAKHHNSYGGRLGPRAAALSRAGAGRERTISTSRTRTNIADRGVQSLTKWTGDCVARAARVRCVWRGW